MVPEVDIKLDHKAYKIIGSDPINMSSAWDEAKGSRAAAASPTSSA